MTEKHTIIIKVSNHVGVLAKISGKLAQRGYNIESTIAAPTEDPDIYKISVVVKEDQKGIQQITKQLNKMVDTIKVTDISHKNNYVVREYLIIKVSVNNKNRSDVLELMDVFKAKALDIDSDYIMMELSGKARKIDRAIKLFKSSSSGIDEYVRSGEFAMSELIEQN